MRAGWGCLSAAAALVACSSFSPGEGPNAADASVDASPPDANVSDADVTDAATGCAKAACGIELATGQDGASEIVADDELVAWTIDRAANGEVRSVPATGGSKPRRLAGPDDHPKSLQIFGDQVVYATGTAVRYTDKNGSGDCGTQPAIPATIAVTSVRRASNVLVVARGSEIASCPTTGGNFGCGGGAPDLLAFPSPPRGLAVDPGGTHVWFLLANAIRGATAAPFKVDVSWTIADAQRLAIDSTRVYYARSGAPAIFSNAASAADTAQATKVTDTPNVPWAIAVDATHVYFTLLEAGKVMKVPKGGGTATPIATDVVEPKGIALHGDRIFVVLGDGRIVSLPKN
jgi:hypothetical protein